MLIWLAYLAIPAALIHCVRRRRDIPFSWMFLMFGLFIVACGCTHLMEVVTFLTPLYRLSGLIKLITAVVSWATVLGLLLLVPKVLALRYPQELEKEIASRKAAEEALWAHARQQVAVAELGQRGLAGTGLDTLMEDAVAMVAQSLNVEYSRIMELLPGGQELLLRAGKGWREGAVGRERFPAGADSMSGYALLQREPVIVENLRAETRYRVPPFLQAHGVVSSLSVVIQGSGGPFGVLGASTTTPRTFTGDEIHFLRSVAHVLGMAIVRKQAEEALRRAHAELELHVRERTANLGAAIEALQRENAERRRAEERLQAFTTQLERSNRELQDFASVASHDLQEPLRKIQGFAGRLPARCAAALDQQGRDYLERMENAAERMRTLIQDLLAFSRITTKAQPFAPVNLTQVARGRALGFGRTDPADQRRGASGETAHTGCGRNANAPTAAKPDQQCLEISPARKRPVRQGPWRGGEW